MHARQYANLPWSKTPLRFFFHREVPFGGNNNSVNVSGTKLRTNRNNTVFQSTHVAAFKMVINFDAEGDEAKDVNLMSIDTGMNGHPFQGHYFDMNNDHIYGRLPTMKIGRQLEHVPVNRLLLRNEKEDPMFRKKEQASPK